MNIDFEHEFSKFVNSGDGSAIQDIYKIIPAIGNEQIKILNTLNYYIKKYDLEELREVVQEYVKSMTINKNLSFMKSMNVRNLLKAYTQEELIKGIRVSSQTNKEDT